MLLVEDVIKDPVSDLTSDDVWLCSSFMVWHFYVKSTKSKDHASVNSTKGRDSLSLIHRAYTCAGR